MTVVAAFDFDETLTSRDTVVPFLRRFTTLPRFAVASMPHVATLVGVAARRDRDGLRALATRLVLGGRSLEEVESEAETHGAQIAQHWLRSDTTERLRWHLAHDHLVVIVSASYEQYVHVVAERLGSVGVVATRLEVVNGECSGRLDGPNCRGVEKVVRLDAWLAARGLERRSVTLYAYGDSAGDRELLAAADHPHWVDEPLASVAPSV